MVNKLHQLFNEADRYTYKDIDKISSNGIYIMFEKGEKFSAFDRVVNVGTHDGEDNFQGRLKEHFIKEDKNRSILRKNIGRSFLYKEKNPYLKYWNIDTISREKKEKYLSYLKPDLENSLERKITNYMRENFSFTFFCVDSKEKRLFWKYKIISTLSQSEEFKPSSDWLGNHSPKSKIRYSGLWQEKGLEYDKLTPREFELLSLIIKKDF